MAASTRGIFLIEGYCNTPILGTTGRVLGNTGFLFRTLFFLDTLFGDVNPADYEDELPWSDYDSDYSPYGSYYGPPDTTGGGYVSYGSHDNDYGSHFGVFQTHSDHSGSYGPYENPYGSYGSYSDHTGSSGSYIGHSGSSGSFEHSGTSGSHEHHGGSFVNQNSQNELTGSSYTSYRSPTSSYSTYDPHSRAGGSSSSAQQPFNSYHSIKGPQRKRFVIGNSRSLAEDQKAIYEQLAASLSAVGVDGRICLLRFICEAQHTRIQKLNLLGKMLATFLTPKEDNFLEEYNKASALGKAGECGGNFESCPISLFNIFNYSKNGKLSKNKTEFEKKKVYHKKP